jgi:hypothetical protein
MLFVHIEPAQLLQLLASTIFPLLIGLITTRDTHPARRAILLAALSVSTSLAAQLAVALQSGKPYDLIAALLAALVSFLVAVGMHFGLWNPTGAAAVVQSLGSSADHPLPAALPASQPAAAPAARVTLPTAAAAPAAIPGTVLPAAPAPAVTVAAGPAVPELFAPVDTPYFQPAAIPGTVLPAAAAAPVIHDPAETFVDPARPS